MYLLYFKFDVVCCQTNAQRAYIETVHSNSDTAETAERNTRSYQTIRYKQIEDYMAHIQLEFEKTYH